MTMQRRVSATVLACGAALFSLAGAGSADAAALPDGAAPTGFRSVDGPNGGRILDGRLPGAASPEAAFAAGRTVLAGYFGRDTSISGAVRTPDGHDTLALFYANLRGAPITGIAISAFDPKGGSHADILFDTSESFKRSLPALYDRLRKIAPQVAHGTASASDAGAAAPALPLTTYAFQDGTGSIALPAGWTPKKLGEGAAVAIGPNGEQIFMGFSVDGLDPNGSLARQERSMGYPEPRPMLPYTSDPGAMFAAVRAFYSRKRGDGDPQVRFSREATAPGPGGWKNIDGTLVDRGVTQRFSGQFGMMGPGPDGGWQLTSFAVSAPAATYAREEPTLRAIAKSYTYNNEARMAQVNTWLAANFAQTKSVMAARQQAGLDTMNARFESSMANARAVQDGIDRSAAGVINYVQGTDVIEHTGSGARATIDADWAASIVQQNPNEFRTVPVSEYRKGSDY